MATVDVPLQRLRFLHTKRRDLWWAMPLLTFVVFVGYGVFAASVRKHVIARPRVLTWMRRTFAGGFAALGAKLALAER